MMTGTFVSEEEVGVLLDDQKSKEESNNARKNVPNTGVADNIGVFNSRTMQEDQMPTKVGIEEEANRDVPVDNVEGVPVPPDEADPASDDKPERLWWLDWCRTQSVWNVVCGHAWWATMDETKYKDTLDPRYNLVNLGNFKNHNSKGNQERVWDGTSLFSHVNISYYKKDSGGFSPGGTHMTGMEIDLINRHREESNMIEYTVEQGALHTIPLFFLLSGYISAVSSDSRGYPKKGAEKKTIDNWLKKSAEAKKEERLRDPSSCSSDKADNAGLPTMTEYLESYAKPLGNVGEPSVGMFAFRRIQRLMLPWVFGTLCAMLPREIIRSNSKGEGISIMELVFSDLYFLYVLFAFALLNYPFAQFTHAVKGIHEAQFVALRQGIGGEDGPYQERISALKKQVTMFASISFTIYLAFPLVASFIFTDYIRMVWVLIPIVTFVFAAVCYLIGLNMNGSTTSGMFFFAATVAYPIASMVLAVPGLRAEEFETGTDGWLSPNMWVTFILFHFCYAFGYSARVFETHIRYWYRTVVLPHTLGVFFILTSFAWPIITFWGARTIRRVGPWMSYYDDRQRVLGMARTWCWMLFMIIMARTFANGKVHRIVHKHVCASAMIIYMFHRFSQEIWLPVGKDNLAKFTENGYEREGSGDWNRLGMAGFLMFINILTCFSVYFVLQLHWIPRKLFGIENL